jgi:low temperature requirement protein LtrA
LSAGRVRTHPLDNLALRDPEQRTTPVELLWDLVYAFAITQVATLLAASMTWASFGRAMLMLALVWWAWSAYVWAANAQSAASPTMRWVLLVATGFIFVAGLSVPHAFGSAGLLFVTCYAVVRLLHLALYADASRQGGASAAAIAGFALTVAAGLVLLFAGAAVQGTARVLLWAAAVAIDYAGPAWLTRERLRGLQRVAVAHFAERYSLFVIICLGESIISAGAGAFTGPSGEARAITTALVVAVACLLVVAVGMWWAYFDRAAGDAEARLAVHEDPVLAAADGYSYLHLPIVAGIIIFAVGAKLLVRGAPSEPLSDAPRLALCAGIALYLLAHAAFEVRLGARMPRDRAVAAIALLALYALTTAVAGWAVCALAAAVIASVCAWETVR